MKIYKFGEKINGEISLCLGYFDGVHKGHRKLFSLAENARGETTVFTFEDEIKTAEKRAGVIFTLEERLEIFSEIGVENVILARFEKIKDYPSEEFLCQLNKTYNISSVVCGFDYKFGKNASGDIQTLKSAMGEKLIVCEKVQFQNHRASSSMAKTLIENGEVSQLAKLLGREYFVQGYCEKGFQNGTKLGFPTANIKPDKSKILLKEGVYIGRTKIDNKMYKSMINVGKIPTFGGEEYKIETHAVGISQPLYGEQITVYFERFLRDVVKFASVEQLKAQLQKDIKEIL